MQITREAAVKYGIYVLLIWFMVLSLSLVSWIGVLVEVRPVETVKAIKDLNSRVNEGFIPYEIRVIEGEKIILVGVSDSCPMENIKAVYSISVLELDSFSLESLNDLPARDSYGINLEGLERNPIKGECF